MESVFTSLIAGIILSFGGWYIRYVYLRIRLKHLQYLLKKSKKLKIVLPVFYSPLFTSESRGRGAEIPQNIFLMPLAEGRAITKFAQAVTSINSKCEIIYQTPEEFNDDGIPFISVGGPSVNSLTESILNDSWSRFKLIYPEHYAKMGDMIFKPEIAQNKLIRDFGFIFQTKLHSGTKSIIFCGVWALGTEISVSTYLKLFNDKDKRYTQKKLRKGNDILIISEAEINNSNINVPNVIGWHEC
jgi:hypothetical protein